MRVFWLFALLWSGADAALASERTFLVWEPGGFYRMGLDGSKRRVLAEPKGAGELDLFFVSPDGDSFLFHHQGASKISLLRGGKALQAFAVAQRAFSPGQPLWSADGSAALRLEVMHWGSADVPISYGYESQQLSWVRLADLSTGSYKVSRKFERMSREPLRYKNQYNGSLGTFLGWDPAGPLLLFRDPKDETRILRVKPGQESPSGSFSLPPGHVWAAAEGGCALVSAAETGRLALLDPQTRQALPLPLPKANAEFRHLACDRPLSRLAVVHAGREGLVANRWQLSLFAVSRQGVKALGGMIIGPPRGLRWLGQETLLIEDPQGLGAVEPQAPRNRRPLSKTARLQWLPLRLPYGQSPKALGEAQAPERGASDTARGAEKRL